jgi:o-succinylbenzoate synthase
LAGKYTNRPEYPVNIQIDQLSINLHLRMEVETKAVQQSSLSIKDVQYHHYKIPLCNTLQSAHEVLAVREGIIIEIQTNEGLIGYGESAPLPKFGGCTLPKVITSLNNIADQLRALSITNALQFIYQQEATLPAPTLYGLETALLDILGQHNNCALYHLLANSFALSSKDAGIRTSQRFIPVNAVIGAQDLDATLQEAQLALKHGFTCLKIKIGADIPREIERIATLRKTLGPTIHLRLDANEALAYDEAYTLLALCADYDVQYIEQPLRREDLAEMRRLRANVAIPLAADEAITDLASAQQVLTEQAADVLIIKPQLAGGLRMGRQIIQAATQHNVQCVVTSSIDAGIGIASALHLVAASPEITLECGLSTLDKLEDDLIIERLQPKDGLLALPNTPGLGVHLDHTALARYS